ncbi:IBR domain-containing protein [Caenorhabditis elegans]|uniref:IBR domain-containing protein n=1 Tax=Caenorhabditis elegans TaxID=6239 RepID=Q966A6_CAEEL|nr:IBR domain-containing protein [Caenorhabditis elegans]CCD63022.1 IBR domain-containing protein [Caenorhabditis elegans]|eukprot:NP_504360.1 Uncharacterized protein CELE_Y58A7A.3 [Caenorhabditis elegans]
MSDYAESYVSDCEVDPEELKNQSLFDKPRGVPRWLGKPHNSVKERLHNSVKDRTFIQKTVSSSEPLSRNAMDRIEASLTDNLNLDVVYSLNKKNRWQDAKTTFLLAGAPENVNAEVVEKNGLAQFGFIYPEKSTFAVHSRVLNKENKQGEFEIRSAITSSARGQDYSNFLPNTREFSKKANAKVMTLRSEEVDEDSKRQPTVSYNIYKTHRSQDVVGKEMFKAKVVSKSRRHRQNKKVDMENYDDLDEEFEDDEDEVVDSHRPTGVFDLAAFKVRTQSKQAHPKNRKDSELSYDMVDYDELETGSEYSQQFNVQEYLNQEGYTFIQADVTFVKLTEPFEDQINQLRLEGDLRVKDLQKNQYLIDISKRCQPNGTTQDGETTAVIVLTHLKHKTYNMIFNSTIGADPIRRNGENLRKIVSSAPTVLEVITKISGDVAEDKQLISRIKTSEKFYGRPSTSVDWNDLSLQRATCPNQYDNATWANSEELSVVGGKLEWDDLVAMVKKENNLVTCYSSDDFCGFCNRKKKSFELFLIKSSSETKIKCTECLRNEFYREFIARRLPIDLQTETADEMEYLPIFIPLTLLNLYIRTVAETIYKDLGATGDFEKCPSCKSTIFFEEPGNENKTQNRSCPCGYSWCRDCKGVPHWPMNCENYAEWEKKWHLRYAMMNAQGTGTVTLLQFTCHCKTVYYCLLPTKRVNCPGCRESVNLETMNTMYRQFYYSYPPRYRKWEKQYHEENKDTDRHPYQPLAKVCWEIDKIPAIKASVIETCGAARDVRFDLKFRNRVIKQEQVLIKKSILTSEVLENILGTIPYLVENVTAWMHMSNHQDKNLKSILESMIADRKDLVYYLESENEIEIEKCVKILRAKIDSVVSIVEKNMKNC